MNTYKGIQMKKVTVLAKSVSDKKIKALEAAGYKVTLIII